MEIIEATIADLPDYARVPIAFRVESRFRVDPVESGLGGLALVEEPVPPYIKDYDGPSHWSERWDLSRWGILGAFEGTQWIGGAAIAWKTDGLSPHEGRDDLAILWDLRVHPDYRGQGAGHLLFTRACVWARQREYRQLMAETQNINVPACRFYARQGCILGAIHQYAYADLPEEVQLLWYQNL